MSEPIDLTSRVLEQIREELRAQREDLRAYGDAMTGFAEHVVGQNRRLEAIEGQLVVQNERMGFVETTLRDLAEQVVVGTRALKTALDARARDDARLEDHEQRIGRLEARLADTSG